MNVYQGEHRTYNLKDLATSSVEEPHNRKRLERIDAEILDLGQLTDNDETSKTQVHGGAANADKAFDVIFEGGSNLVDDPQGPVDRSNDRKEQELERVEVKHLVEFTSVLLELLEKDGEEEYSITIGYDMYLRRNLREALVAESIRNVSRQK